MGESREQPFCTNTNYGLRGGGALFTHGLRS